MVFVSPADPSSTESLPFLYRLCHSETIQALIPPTLREPFHAFLSHQFHFSRRTLSRPVVSSLAEMHAHDICNRHATTRGCSLNCTSEPAWWPNLQLQVPRTASVFYIQVLHTSTTVVGRKIRSTFMFFPEVVQWLFDHAVYWLSRCIGIIKPFRWTFRRLLKTYTRCTNPPCRSTRHGYSCNNYFNNHRIIEL